MSNLSKIDDDYSQVLFWEHLLQKRDNPHEIMDVTCEICRTREIDSRENLNSSGWRVAELIGNEDQVYTCKECFDPEFD